MAPPQIWRNDGRDVWRQVIQDYKDRQRSVKRPQDSTLANGWHISVGRQNHKDYPPFVALARKCEGKVIRMVNAEGNTPEEATEKVKRKIAKFRPK